MAEPTPAWASEPVVRAVLALAGVPGVLVALLVLFALTGDVARVDALSRALQGAMLAILGFYFGRVDVGRAQREADEAKAKVVAAVDRATAVVGLAERTEDHAARAEQVLEAVERDPQLRARIDELMRRNGES